MARDFVFNVNDNSELPPKPSSGFRIIITNGEIKLLNKDGKLVPANKNLEEIIKTTSYSPNVLIDSISPNTFIINQTKTIIIKGYFLDFISSINVIGRNDGYSAFISIDKKTFDTIEFSITTNNIPQIYDVILSMPDNEIKLSLESFERSILIPGDSSTEWVRVSNGIKTSLGQMEPKTPNVSSWSNGASFGNIPANKDLELEWNVGVIAGETKGYMMIGLDSSDPNKNYNTIDYALYTAENFNVYIYENGSRVSTIGAYTFSDDFKITRTGNVIKYFQNNNLIYTSLSPSNSQLVFDSSIYRNLLAKNIKITHDI